MAPPKHSPIPPLPTKVTIPNITVTSKTSGTIQVPAASGFFYAGIQSIWAWWRVELPLLRSYLEPLDLVPYDFGGGMGAVNINFFNAAALYGSGEPGNPGVSGFNETEVNIVSYASKVASHVPQGLSLEQYLTLGEQTKRVGNYPPLGGVRQRHRRRVRAPELLREQGSHAVRLHGAVPEPPR